jgi:hypothetical protein
VPIPAPKSKPAVVELSRVKVEQTNGVVSISYQAKNKDRLVILDEQGKEVQDAKLHGNSAICPLTNTGDSATILELRFESAEFPLFVAIPGLKSGAPVETAAASGSLRDLARAASEFFNVTVIVAKKNESADLEWVLKTDRRDESILKSVEHLGYTVDEDGSGAIWIR